MTPSKKLIFLVQNPQQLTIESTHCKYTHKSNPSHVKENKKKFKNLLYIIPFDSLPPLFKEVNPILSLKYLIDIHYVNKSESN